MRKPSFLRDFWEAQRRVKLALAPSVALCVLEVLGDWARTTNDRLIDWAWEGRD